MDCRSCHNQLNNYLDGKLSLSQKQELDEHVAACASCHAMLGTHMLVQTFIDNEKAMYPSPFLADRIKETIHNLPQAKRPTPTVWMTPMRQIAAAAAIIACLTSGYLLGQTYVSHMNASDTNEEISMLNDAYIENIDLVLNE